VDFRKGTFFNTNALIFGIGCRSLSSFSVKSLLEYLHMNNIRELRKTTLVGGQGQYLFSPKKLVFDEKLKKLWIFSHCKFDY
jgi:hypothetical protein